MERRDRARNGTHLWLWLGALAVLLTMLPSLLLGGDAVFTYTDQLDGEMIAYILQARHLFHSGGIPEFLGGASKTALVPPAPLAVLLFLAGNPWGALMTLSLAGKLCGYFGMYLLVRETAKEEGIALAAGFLYSCIPFLAVYGLTEYGLPMLFWCALCLKRRKNLRGAYLYTALYGLCSSLVLAGFAVLGLGAAWLLWIRFSLGKGAFLRPGAAWLLLLAVYLAENWRLLAQLLGIGEKIVTHKTGYVLSARPFKETFWTGLLVGNQHCQGYHAMLLVGTLVSAAAGCLWLLRQKKANAEDIGIRRLLGTIAFCFGCNLSFVLLSCLWNSPWGVDLRHCLSFLGAFQLDRVMWLSPCLWHLAAACGLAIAYRLSGQAFRYVPFLLLTAGASAATALWALYSGEPKLNLQKLKNPDYAMLSYRDYYAIGVMEQVRDFLDTYTGKDVSSYRVASLGIDPAAALYHGFYCLDGYSNNYPLEYKERFRQIISPELDRDEYLRQYYDNWGNRCYLFNSECHGYYTVEKHGFFFQDYRIDKDAFYGMGGRFLLSAAYIQNAEEQGLWLLNEVPFETEDSYYYLFVYEVRP